MSELNIQDIAGDLKKIDRIRLFTDEPLSGFCSFGTGGPADILVKPESEEGAAAVIRYCRERSVPVTVLGCGSNILISDKGIRGVVLVMQKSLQAVVPDEAKGELRCEAGSELYQMAAAAARCSLSGAEFSCGIPGSIGGAVYMNAGAYESCMADIVKSVRFADEKGCIRELPQKELDFSYRHSAFADRPWIVLSALIKLSPADPRQIYDTMAALQLKRRNTQPLDMKSAGSSFKRPQGHFAGKLISDAGLKGYRRGEAGVSAKHAGFIINYGRASSAEIWQIFQYVRERVLADSGVLLEPEVRRLGEWED